MKRPFYKKWWFWTIIMVIVLVAAFQTQRDNGTADNVSGNIESENTSVENDSEENNKTNGGGEDEGENEDENVEAEKAQGDIESCELVEEVLTGAEDGTINDEEMLDDLEEAYFLAEDDELFDHIDDLLIHFESGDYTKSELTATVNKIKSYCSLD